MTIEITNDTVRSRYEMHDDGELIGIVDYDDEGEHVVFPHTEVVPERRGEGLAAQLVQVALDDQRRANRRIVPACSFVARFIREHREYADLVTS